MIRIFLKRLFDIIFPRVCVNCGEPLTITEDGFCIGCLLDLPHTNFHLNPRENEMAQLFYVVLPIEKATAWMFYSPHSQASHFVHQMKYKENYEIGEIAGRMLAAEVKDSGFFDGIDVLVPVPITRKRLNQRGYNQSEHIAIGISEITGIPIDTKVLRRKHFHQSQTHLNFYERRENVENAFELRNGERIRGRHVLLVDDIVTYGATIIACGTELMKAGDVKISVISLGYTK